MNILSNYTYNSYKICPAQSFGSAKARKLIEKLTTSKQLKKEKITFDNLESTYNEIGYDVFRKRGSHAVIKLSNGINLPVIIPHGKKYVHPLDLKRFLLVSQNKIDDALRV